MVPKKNRLNSLFFKNLFRKGTIIESPSFSLKYTKENKEDFGISVIISKKVAQKAVERNLLKRRFLSLVLQQKNLLISGFSYIFYLKKDIHSRSQEQINQEIKDILQKIYEKHS